MKKLITLIVIVLGITLFQVNGMAGSKKDIDPATQLTSIQLELKQFKTEL